MKNEYEIITEDELRSGINSRFWRAFFAQLMVSKKEQEELLAKAVKTYEIFRCQGRIEVLQDLMVWPEIQLDAIKADIEFEERMKGDD